MKWIPIVLGLALCANTAYAQTDSTACPPAGDSARAAIRLEASASARSLRLDAPAAARATVRPCDRRDAVRVERGNLPERLQPGVTYRDVRVRVTITADPGLACRLGAALAADSAAARDPACVQPEP